MPSTSSTPIRRHSTVVGQRRELADDLHLIQNRDEDVLDLLDQHLVLTTELIDEALFGALRSCQRRLAQLKELELLASWSPPRQRERGGSGQTRWVLGRLGLDFHAARREERMTAPLKAKAYAARLAQAGHIWPRGHIETKRERLSYWTVTTSPRSARTSFCAPSATWSGLAASS